jgi:hypothetical protein
VGAERGSRKQFRNCRSSALCGWAAACCAEDGRAMRSGAMRLYLQCRKGKLATSTVLW